MKKILSVLFVALAIAKQQADGRVVGHKCDQTGVNGLTILVTKPGVLYLRWDNNKVCVQA